MNRLAGRSAALLLAALFIAPTFQGCSSYRYGSMLPPDIETVYIPAIKNRTREPFVEVEATKALLRELQTDGSLIVATEEEADAVLEVQLNRFTLRELVYSREDRLRPDEYRAILSASLKLVRTDNGQVLVQEPYVSGDFAVPFVTDITSAKRRVLPDVSRDLAHDIVERIVEAWPEKGDPEGWGGSGRSGAFIPDPLGGADSGYDTDGGSLFP